MSSRPSFSIRKMTIRTFLEGGCSVENVYATWHTIRGHYKEIPSSKVYSVSGGCQEMNQTLNSSIKVRTGCGNPCPRAEEAWRVFTCTVNFVSQTPFFQLLPSGSGWTLWGKADSTMLGSSHQDQSLSVTPRPKFLKK